VSAHVGADGADLDGTVLIAAAGEACEALGLEQIGDGRGRELLPFVARARLMS